MERDFPTEDAEDTSCRTLQERTGNTWTDAYRNRTGPFADVPETDAEMPYILYFITCRKPDYPVKIGISKRGSLKARLSSIQTSMPYDLEVLFLCACEGYAMERETHYALRRYRMRGEWFKRHDEVISIVQDMAQDYPDWRETAGLMPDDFS